MGMAPQSVMRPLHPGKYHATLTRLGTQIKLMIREKTHPLQLIGRLVSVNTLGTDAPGSALFPKKFRKILFHIYGI